LTIDKTAPHTYAGSIGGAISLIKEGASTQTLSGTNTYSGGTTVNNGTLNVSGTLLSGAHTVSVGSGATIQVSTAAGTNNTLGFDAAESWLVAGTINVTGGNANTLPGTVTLNGGTLTSTTGEATFGAYFVNNAVGGTITANGVGNVISAVDIGIQNLSTLILDTPLVGDALLGSTVIKNRNTVGHVGALRKEGLGTVTLSGANTYTGATTINGGTLSLSGTSGAIAGSSSVTIQSGSTLLLNNTSAANNINRVGAVTITMNGSTLNFSNNAGAVNYSETVGTLSIAAGANTVSASQAAVGQTSTLTFGSLSRTAGAYVDFTGTGLGVDTRNRILFTAAPALSNGLIGTWATYNGTDFATYGGNGVAAASSTDVTRLNSGPQTIANGSTTNVKIVEGSGSPANITLGAATTTINSLNQSASGGGSTATIDPAGQTLRTNAILVGVGAGALTIGTGTNNGTLTTATSGGDLLLNNQTTNGLTINSVIANNTSASTLTKVGAGTATLTGVNTYTGATIIANGTLALNGDNRLATTGAVFFGFNSATSPAPTVGTLDLSTTPSDQTVSSLSVFTNTSSANTINIGSGKTLTVNGTVTIGASGASPPLTSLDVNGAGGWTVTNVGGAFQVGGGTADAQGNRATLDMSGLTTFSANLGTSGGSSAFRVGDAFTGGVYTL
jgi:autotransporter-associated beta strand protein